MMKFTLLPNSNLVKLITYSTILVLLIFPALTIAKPTVGPPSINLRSNLANISVAKLDRKTKDYHLIFTKIKDLHNQSNNLITIVSNKDVAKSLTLNHEYIIAFSSFQSTRKLVRVYKRKDGAVLINLTGASPAIFENNQDILTMLNWNIDDSLTSPKEMLATIMSGIKNTNTQIQSFFVTEIMTRNNIHQYMTSADFEVIIEILQNSNTNAEIRSLILNYIKVLDKHLTNKRLMTILNSILINSSTQFKPSSYKPALIRQSLVKIREFKGKINSIDLSRWLSSNNTAIIEDTLDSLRIITPNNYMGYIDKELNKTNLSNEARFTIETYKKRMKRGKQ